MESKKNISKKIITLKIFPKLAYQDTRCVCVCRSRRGLVCSVSAY